MEPGKSLSRAQGLLIRRGIRSYIPCDPALPGPVPVQLPEHDVLLSQIMSKEAERQQIGILVSARLQSRDEPRRHDEVGVVEKLDRSLLDEEPEMGAVEDARIPIREPAAEQEREQNADVSDVGNRDDDLAPGVQPLAQASQGAGAIDQMLENVEQQDQIVGLELRQGFLDPAVDRDVRIAPELAGKIRVELDAGRSGVRINTLRATSGSRLRPPQRPVFSRTSSAGAAGFPAGRGDSISSPAPEAAVERHDFRRFHELRQCIHCRPLTTPFLQPR